jgi:hypothetical protein
MILRRARVMPAESVFTHGQGPSSSRGVFQKQMTNDATNATMSLQEGQTWGGLDLELGLPPPPSLLLPLPVSLLYTHSLPPYCCPYPCPYCTLTPSCGEASTLSSASSSPSASTAPFAASGFSSPPASPSHLRVEARG